MSENTQTYTPGAEQPPAGPPPAARPPLRRSRTDRKVAGVAGGLGAYLGIDPVILRILFVVLAIFGGSGLLLYLVAWLLIPEEGAESSEVQRFVDRNGTAALVILGIVVAAIFQSQGMVRTHFPELGHQLFGRLRQGALVHAHAGGRLVDQIDRFVRQKSLGHVAGRKVSGGIQGLIRNRQAMVLFVGAAHSP